MPALLAPAVTLDAWRGDGQPTLTGHGLRVRPWAADDVDTLVRAYADPAIARWHVQSQLADEAAAWIGSRAPRWHSGTGADWAVTATGTTGTVGAVLGRVALNRLDLFEGDAEVAYWVLPEARGRQVAPRAVDVLVRWLFATHAIDRVALRHSVRNPASGRVAARAGFTREGTLREAGRHADGRHDMHLWARLRADPAPELDTAAADATDDDDTAAADAVDRV